LREALSRWAEETGDLEVVDELTRGEEALVSATHSPPDLVVLEADIPGMNGFETAGALSRDIPDLGIIIIAESGGPDLRKRAADVGAKGFVSKTWGREAFRDVVRLVREGGSPVLVEVYQDTPGPPSR
jgi:two-component system response regulator DesR